MLNSRWPLNIPPYLATIPAIRQYHRCTHWKVAAVAVALARPIQIIVLHHTTFHRDSVQHLMLSLRPIRVAVRVVWAAVLVSNQELRPARRQWRDPFPFRRPHINRKKPRNRCHRRTWKASRKWSTAWTRKRAWTAMTVWTRKSRWRISDIHRRWIPCQMHIQRWLNSTRWQNALRPIRQ